MLRARNVMFHLLSLCKLHDSCPQMGVFENFRFRLKRNSVIRLLLTVIIYRSWILVLNFLIKFFHKNSIRKKIMMVCVIKINFFFEISYRNWGKLDNLIFFSYGSFDSILMDVTVKRNSSSSLFSRVISSLPSWERDRNLQNYCKESGTAMVITPFGKSIA